MTMRTTILLCASFLALPALGQAVTIVFNPPAVDAVPGALAGWGFTIYNESSTDWVSFSGSALVDETNPALGTYTDLLGPQGGPTNYALGPLATWTQPFSDPNQTGVGEYAISISAVPGAVDSGSIRVMWDDFTSDPTTCNDCFGGSFSQDVAFQVTVDGQTTSSVPEPGSLWMVLIGGACFAGVRRQYAGRSPGKQRARG
jgi:hypothetical protein